MKFEKFHGTGNDFIIFEASEVHNENYNELALKVCDRHFGIGADGMMVVEESNKADIKMCFYNADGSEATMCGNGIRCFSKYVYEKYLVKNKVFNVETLAGIMKIEVTIDSLGYVEGVKVNMGKPLFTSDLIPENGVKKMFLNEDIEVDGEIYKVSSIFLGTIHTVIFVDDFTKIDMKNVGSKIENNKIYPKKTNVNFCKIIDKDNIELTTWEKGVGFTLACGTGAASTAVVSRLLGNTNGKVKVKIAGGELLIEDIYGDIFMTGPAKRICVGEYLK